MTLYRPRSRSFPGPAIIDFRSERLKREELRTDEAARHAAGVLAEFRAGFAPVTDVLAALVAPFNDAATCFETGAVKELRSPAETLEAASRPPKGAPAGLTSAATVAGRQQ